LENAIYARDFTFERGSDSHICNAVKETFQKLSDTLDQVDAQALPDIIRVLRCSIMSKIFSRSLMHRIRNVLLARELDGSSKIEQLSGDSKMAWINTTEVIYRLAAFGVWSPNELVRIEGHIRESVNSDDWGSLQSDAAADFLSACCLYNYKLDLELVEKLEQLLVVELQGRDTTQALFCRVAHYAGLGILFQKGSMSPDMWRIAERAADENEERASTFQERVIKLLRMTGLKVVENYRVGSCTFDAAVFISKDQLINVEIDGFPYHSVFLLDEMRFCREAQTPGNRLRDAALKKLGIPVLRLTGEICASGSDRAQAADLKRKIEGLVAAKRV
jgi:hypothetical protein